MPFVHPLILNRENQTKTCSPSRTGTPGSVHAPLCVTKIGQGRSPSVRRYWPQCPLEVAQELGVFGLIKVVDRGHKEPFGGSGGVRRPTIVALGSETLTPNAPNATAEHCPSRSSWRWQRPGAPPKPGPRIRLAGPPFVNTCRCPPLARRTGWDHRGPEVDL